MERSAEGGGLPTFIEGELRAYLRCGVLANGFLRARCDACGHDRLVAFSCKGRGMCPSCGGRRMADTAAWFRDEVLAGMPAPRVNLVRYHGVFAPASPLRRLIVSDPLKLNIAQDARALSMGHTRPKTKPPGRKRLSWTALMMHVFGVDVLLCPSCQGRMRLIAR